MASDLVEDLNALHVWPQMVADDHADLLTPRRIEGLYEVGRVATRAADRITELEGENLAHKLHIAELSGDCLAKRDRITHQDAVIAGLVEALEKARSDLHLIALESRISYDVQRMVVASKEHCHEALAKAKESRDV